MYREGSQVANALFRAARRGVLVLGRASAVCRVEEDRRAAAWRTSAHGAVHEVLKGRATCDAEGELGTRGKREAGRPAGVRSEQRQREGARTSTATRMDSLLHN
jgi:hypothetical protein